MQTITEYKRSFNSPWVTMPNMSQRSVKRWLLTGVYYCYRVMYEDKSYGIVTKEAGTIAIGEKLK